VKIHQLRPAPVKRTQFSWSHRVVVPNQPGCYALVAYSGDILYIGLSSISIGDRMARHLDTIEKRKPAAQCVAFWFYYLLCAPARVRPIERGWINQVELEDGTKPPLNKIASPL
jgi:hypothetical protein